MPGIAGFILALTLRPRITVIEFRILEWKELNSGSGHRGFE